MSVDISRLAYAVRKASDTTSHPLNHGHALELIAAALGYGSLAAYKAAASAGNESADLAGAAHVLLQIERIQERSAELAPTAPAPSRLNLIQRAFQECLPRARLHKDENSLFDTLVALVDTSTFNHGKTSGEMAGTNGAGMREIYLPLSFSLDELPPVGEPHELEIVGHITMEIDDERPYSGHRIDVRARLTLARLGRAVIAEPIFELESAKLDYGWSDDDHFEGPPKVSLAQALAEELDLSLEEAEQLADVEPIPNEGHDGALYGFVFYFEDVDSPALRAKLIERGKTVLRVLPSFFDRVVPEV